MKKESLAMRLYFEPAYYELARAVNYGGIRDLDLEERMKELRDKYGPEKVLQAYCELTAKSEKLPEVTVLRPEVRKVCRQLLGPPPEDPEYTKYYEINKMTPPENHRPPAVGWKGAKAGGKTEKPKSAPSKADTEFDYSGLETEELQRVLQIASEQLKEHGEKSFEGEQARAKVTAAEQELRSRGCKLPRDGPAKAKKQGRKKPRRTH